MIAQVATIPRHRPPTPIDWSSAACHGMGTDLFFDQSTDDASLVRPLCLGCPIRTECMFFGFTQSFGMWGGLSERDRRKTKVVTGSTYCDSCGRLSRSVPHPTLRVCASVCGRCGVGWHAAD